MIQTSMEKEFHKLSSKLDNVIERMDTLEKTQNAMEEQINNNCHTDGPPTGTPKTPASGKRQRLTPVALQVHKNCDKCIYSVTVCTNDW